MKKCPICKETKYVRYVNVKTKSKVLTYVGCSKCCYCKLVREDVDMSRIDDFKDKQGGNYA